MLWIFCGGVVVAGDEIVDVSGAAKRGRSVLCLDLTKTLGDEGRSGVQRCDAETRRHGYNIGAECGWTRWKEEWAGRARGWRVQYHLSLDATLVQIRVRGHMKWGVKTQGTCTHLKTRRDHPVWSSHTRASDRGGPLHNQKRRIAGKLGGFSPPGQAIFCRLSSLHSCPLRIFVVRESLGMLLQPSGVCQISRLSPAPCFFHPILCL